MPDADLYQQQPPHIKAAVYDRIVNHLLRVALNDARPREQKRTKLALRRIRAWIEEIRNV